MLLPQEEEEGERLRAAGLVRSMGAPAPTLHPHSHFFMWGQSPLPFCSVAHPFSYSILRMFPSLIPFCTLSQLPYCSIFPLPLQVASILTPTPLPCSPAPVPPPSLLLLHWWSLCPSSAAIRPTALTDGEEEKSARYKQH